jgi:ABC-type cobalt transport system substrate-binding protein
MLKGLFKKKLRFGDAYAVQTGDYAGQMYIFIEKTKDSYEFLSSPLMENRSVPVEKFDFALQEGIIEYVERLPRYVRNITRAKFKENESFYKSA